MIQKSLQKETRDIILDSIADGVFYRRRPMEDHLVQSSGGGDYRGVDGGGIGTSAVATFFHANICENECALREAIRTGKAITSKPIYIIRADGRRIPISISATTLEDRDGNVIGGVETFRDLSVIEELRKELDEKYTFADIVARSAAMRRLLAALPQLAESTSTVLIEGASGTGKELIARAIHNLSPRSKKRFVAINCGALPDTLLESELFGYKAGAFTDAKTDKPGRFSAAEGGTLFLDEIGDISPAMQVKLLRVLQERAYEPLGSIDTVRADVRVIAATNRNLLERVKEGHFREDLFYRINVVRLELPPLRERREDVPLLIRHFIDKLNRLQEKSVAGVSEEAMAVLLDYDYPGNIRELENAVEHAFVLCREGLIEPYHLPPEIQKMPAPDEESDRSLTLEQLESMHIAGALRRHHGNRKAAAEELGIHPSTLFRKVKALGIDLPETDGRSGRGK